MTQNVVKYKHHTESEKTLLFNEKFNRNTDISLLRDDSYPNINYLIIRPYQLHILVLYVVSNIAMTKLIDKKIALILTVLTFQAVDRNAYDLHAKINHLTQQLIRKTTEVAEKEDVSVKIIFCC